jgi:acyl carrier protein
MTDTATTPASAPDGSGKDDDRVREVVVDMIVEMAPSADAIPDLSAKLIDDLGYHSLALLELAFSLEDEFDLEPLDEETAREIVTVRDVQNIVIRMLAERHGA